MKLRAVGGWYGWLLAVASFGLAIGFAWAPRGIATNDADAAMLPAWALVHRGNLAVPSEYLNLRVLSEIVSRHGQLYSDRPLGMILAAVPGQLFWHHPSRWGLTLTAALLAALTAWCAFRLWGARATLLVLAGTPLLYVGARTLWPETICVAGLLVGLLLVRSERHLWLISPLVAVLTVCRLPFGLLAVLVFGVLIGRRSAVWLPVSGALGGLLGLLAYSHAVFGGWSVAGGYPVAHRFVLSSLWVGLVSPARGVLWWSPWLLFLRPRRDRGTLVLALTACYVVGSWLLYDAWGGEGWVGYRYALPFAVLAAPMIRVPRTRPMRLALLVAVAWSLSVGVMAELVDFTGTPGRHPWSPGIPVVTGALFTAGLVGIALLLRLRSARTTATPPASADRRD